MSNELFIMVIMYLWGDTESHSYPIGIYSSREAAKAAGESVALDRGGKYDPVYFEGKIGETGKWKRVEL